ncbi:glycosyltransferase family 2 protein [Desulfotomaculum copahuensis]|uniref:Glycosyl transferase n=1 Tax=Desulfotomaculum copahuensis TaxID=1838280 RepID=A0A1B7LD57_9FIRM|nr:glycosyltransferase [Desulfotomaculum copahuensis]OAT80852.1 glycosyl transferase [Desulfotomaculum copahuensis]
MPGVLIASPVRQKPVILKEFLWSLEHLETGGLKVDYAFIDDGEGRDLLRQFAAGRPVRIFPGGEGADIYHRDENTHHWRESLIWKVAAYKDRLIRLARTEGYDFLFLVDSDLVLHPRLLSHLCTLGKDIVSGVFWTRWQPDLIPLPQVWEGDQYRLYSTGRDENINEQETAHRVQEFLELLRHPGTYRVGGLGACTLIGKKALHAGVSFSEIYNLGFTGEDRHFCIRAAALGLELYADTHYPVYHIYREADLAGLADFKKMHFPSAQTGLPKRGRITLAMLVRNEADRYLEKVLRHAAQYIDSAVILDDASEDQTAAVCRRVLAGKPLLLVSNREPSFANEIVLRKQLWDLAAGTNPEWLLFLDADEIFEERAVAELPRLAADPEVMVYSFRLYDMWDEGHYREDACWCAHHFHRPFMVRHLPGFSGRWRETPQHCGRLPLNIAELKGANSSLRIKHLGWMKPADRLAKYYRYKKLDPAGRYGNNGQYLSILDPKPRLAPWED